MVGGELDVSCSTFPSFSKGEGVRKLPKLKGFAVSKYGHDVQQWGSNLGIFAGDVVFSYVVVRLFLLYCRYRREIPECELEDDVGGRGSQRRTSCLYLRD